MIKVISSAALPNKIMVSEQDFMPFLGENAVSGRRQNMEKLLKKGINRNKIITSQIISLKEA